MVLMDKMAFPDLLEPRERRERLDLRDLKDLKEKLELPESLAFLEPLVLMELMELKVNPDSRVRRVRTELVFPELMVPLANLVIKVKRENLVFLVLLDSREFPVSLVL